MLEYIGVNNTASQKNSFIFRNKRKIPEIN